MSGLSRDYLAIYVQMLRWALTQQLDFALSRHGLVPPNAGHCPAFKSQLLAASIFSGYVKGKTADQGVGHSPQRGPVNGALP